jgi:hypothetical protein
MCLRVEDSGIGMTDKQIKELAREEPPNHLLLNKGFASSLYIARALAQ